MLVWDVEAIFEAGGDIKGVVALCKRVSPADDPPTHEQVAMWKSRRVIAANWLPVVCAGLLAAGLDPIKLFRKVANAPPSKLNKTRGRAALPPVQRAPSGPRRRRRRAPVPAPDNHA